MRVLLPVLVVVGCGGAGGPELAGDRAYGAARYQEAFAAYRDAAGSDGPGRVWAKLGAAALYAGELRASAGGWRRLAEDDPTRLEEAADGLEAVAREAERRGDAAALQDAVL
ncbi:MAG: hypothetical protein ACREOF_01630, partial [Gemmatimonadales bacterium]